jgi:adhesin/invasin
MVRLIRFIAGTAGMVVLLLSGCSEGNPAASRTGSTGGTGGTVSTAVAIALIATPATIQTGGTSSIQATVTDSALVNVPDGTPVAFSISSATMGSVTAFATTVSGVAVANYTAAAVPGTAVITASSGSAQNSVPVVVSPPQNASVEFVSAAPQVIAVKASGGIEISTVIFQVKDDNGNPVTAGQVVNFTMSGPMGGEYIGTNDATPTTATAATGGNGRASILLHSGSVAGPVTITATVTVSTGPPPVTASSTSSTISIGGGVASASHFNIASSKLNLQGLVTSNVQATISAFIADRFGNYNVLQGTSVSFYTEAGAVDASNITDASGFTSVIFRTQAPIPANVAIDAAETTSIGNIDAAFGTSFIASGVHPRDGHLTVLAAVAGEETFIDANGNGLYDAGELFTDIGEPFIDANDNGVWAAGEFYVDTNGDSTYNGPNTVWDGPFCPDVSAGCLSQKTIWTSMRLAFTGHAINCDITPTTYAVTTAAPQQFFFLLGDANLNAPLAGTSIAVTTTKGTLVGTTAYTVPDAVGGPVVISFTLLDDSDATIDASSVTVEVTPAAGIVACPSTLATGTVE